MLLLAHDVRSWQSSLKDQTLEYGGRLNRASPEDSGHDPSSKVSGTLLSVERIQQWLKALTAFSAAQRATSKLLVVAPSSYASS